MRTIKKTKQWLRSGLIMLVYYYVTFPMLFAQEGAATGTAGFDNSLIGTLDTKVDSFTSDTKLLLGSAGQLAAVVLAFKGLYDVFLAENKRGQGGLELGGAAVMGSVGTIINSI